MGPILRGKRSVDEPIRAPPCSRRHPASTLLYFGIVFAVEELWVTGAVWAGGAGLAFESPPLAEVFLLAWFLFFASGEAFATISFHASGWSHATITGGWLSVAAPKHMGGPAAFAWPVGSA